MADEIRGERSLPRLVIGLAIIVAGILFTLDNLRLVHAEDYLLYWPVVLVAIGIVGIVQTSSWVGYGWSLVWIVAGLWLLGENIGLISISIWALWPLLLVLVGATLIWRACCPPQLQLSVRVRDDAAPGSVAAEPGASRPGAPSPGRDSFIHGFAVLGAVERATDSTSFVGADLVAIMGGCKLDLRRATMAGEEATVDVLALMGGIDILVPEDWTIAAKVLPVMGGLGDKTHPVRSATPKRLVIRGLALMGGVDVKN
jgi:predicted membrane protein